MSDVIELNVAEWGSGDRVAVLVHGITNDSGSWWAVAPRLVDQGYRVLAPELPGHGFSPHDPAAYSPEAAADALVAAVPADVDLLLGHSLGGRVALLAVDRIKPGRAVYEDPAWETATPQMGAHFRSQKGWDEGQVAEHYAGFALGSLKRKWDALQRWDPATVDGLEQIRQLPLDPPLVPSLLVTAEREAIIGPDRAAQARAAGFTVRMVPGARHNIHNDDLEGFFTALEGWI